MEKSITLRTHEGHAFVVPQKVAAMSSVLTFEMEENKDAGEVSIPDTVDAAQLAKALEFCRRHAESPEAPFRVEEGERATLQQAQWVRDVLDVNVKELSKLISCASFLDIPSLLDAAALEIASRVKGKTLKQVRDMFGIVNEFTPEEEAQVMRENAWVYM